MTRSLLLLVGLAAGCVVGAADRGIAAEVGAEHDAGERACHHCHADPHDGAGGTACEGCHGTEAWAPSTFTVAQHTIFAIEGRHRDVACDGCHVDQRLLGLPHDCAGCHTDRHRGKLGGDCGSCHSVEGFTPVDGFDHAVTGFAVDGAHADLGCASCHEGAHGRSLILSPSVDCATCHTPSHGTFARVPGARSRGASTDPSAQGCAACHRTDTSFAATRFDHRATGFELHRRHGSQPCESCHTPGEAAPIPLCASCHADPHSGQLGVICEDCHREDRWRLARFDHDRTGWALRGRHFVAACSDCHTSQRWIGLTTACWDCHASDAAAAPKQVPAHGLGRVDCADCHNAWSWR